MDEKKYSKQELIQAGLDLIEILMAMAMDETEGSASLRHYLKDLTSENGIYKKQKDAIREMTLATNQFEKEAQVVYEKNSENSRQIESICAYFDTLLQTVQNVHVRRDAVTEKVAILHKSIADINLFVKSIQEISEQTNLLSFNASIEAARAGVAGRGFRIIAGEVKKLSNDTTAIAKNISKQINEISQSIQGLISENDLTNVVMKDLKEMAIESNKTLLAVKNDNLEITTVTKEIVNEITKNKERIFNSAEDVEKQNIHQIEKIANQAADNILAINEQISFLKEMREIFNYLKDTEGM